MGGCLRKRESFCVTHEKLHETHPQQAVIDRIKFDVSKMHERDGKGGRETGIKSREKVFADMNPPAYINGTMTIPVKYTQALLDEVMMALKITGTKKELKEADERIGLGEDYIYNSLVLSIRNKRPFKPQDAKLKMLLAFLQYKNFEEFKNKVDHPIGKQLASCVGVYYSYVRRNMDDSILFRSPLRFHIDEGVVKVEFKGGRLKYEGAIKIENGCLFVPLESKTGKAFYHIYSIGTTEAPRVLQGVFSGVSNQYEPIAGRAVIVRVDEQFEALKNDELSIASLGKGKSRLEKNLAIYFTDRDRNNLWINRPYTFDERDLTTGESLSGKKSKGI